MKKSTIKLLILTPNGIFFDDFVNIATIKTKEGYIGIQKDKSKFISSILTSDLRINYQNEQNFKVCAISDGIIETDGKIIKIITSSIEFKDKIDLLRAQQAKTRAELKLNQKLSINEIEKAQFALKKAINRINIKKTNY